MHKISDYVWRSTGHHEPINRQVERLDVDEVHSHAVPFVSEVGPSRIKCQSCGYQFLRAPEHPGDPLTTEHVEAARRRRAAHFAEVYRASTAGTPDGKSTHCSIHRAVQHTFLARRSIEDNVAVAAAYLRVRDGRGNVYSPTLEQEMLEVAQSFAPFADRYASLMHMRPAKDHVSFSEALCIELQIPNI